MAEDRKIVLESKEVLVEKWDEVLEQKGKYAEVYGTGAPKLRDDKQRAFMATMLESLEQTVLKENTVAGDVAVANPTLIPILRRITPQMIGPEMFGTQPMRTSNGVIYYLRSLYTGKDADNLKYGATKSSLFVLSTTGGLVAGATITQAGGLVGTVKYTETQGTTYYALVEATATAATAAAQATIGTVSGTISSVIANEAAFQFILNGYSGPYTTSMTSYGANATNSANETMTNHNEMGFTIEQDIMIAKKRTLKTRWSRELEEDLRNDKNINAKELLVQLCSDEISREMNREFLATMDATCTAGNSNSYTLAYASLDGRYEGEKYQNVCAAIDRIAFQTALRNRRGPANILICNAKALSVLRATGRLEGGAGAGINSTDAGTFEGKKVLFDLWADNSNPIVWLIYKGGEQDAGHFYGPYSPLRIDEGVGPEDNIPRLFFTTRYGLQANKFGAETYYAKLTMTGFPGYSWTA